MLMLGLSGCNRKTEEHFERYEGLVGVIGYDFSVSSTTLKTRLGMMAAPQLDRFFSASLFNEDVVLCEWLDINQDVQPWPGFTVVWDLFFHILDKKIMAATEGGKSASDEYIAPIDDVASYDMVGNFAVLWIFHTAPGFQRYHYEMTYDPDEEAAITTVYIRAKEDDVKDNNAVTTFRRWCAFDMNAFVKAKKSADNKLMINIRFKTGEADGEEVWKDWEGNPLELKVE